MRSDIAPTVQAPDVTAQIKPAIDEIAATLPPGMRIEAGGAVEESAKANIALFKIFPLMFLAMLTILMVQLHRFSTLFLVLSTAPLGLIGASFSLLAFDAPFGFNALLGLIALAGMIMRNTVILIDQIDADVATGLSRWNAIIESTVRRSRPLVLTAMAAILAMIPLSRSVFWGPMATTMMGGTLGGDDSDASLPSGSLCSLVPSTQTRTQMRRSSRVAAGSSIKALTSGDRHFRLSEGFGAGRIHLG